uniref:Major facilitator superfamily (MFS) profile domain-containing protein n=1 Tax=Helicotheca tamesis TaxID=374047 RepID=A0A7S2IF83_9STRA|mmetsp:Transcript_8628/g.11922  ORF Transcript_8628/g.11922 Transcript_8628/m.11922 type:complete len:521 (+) Transcript_8628:141-1703(+)|eukprot:CAMPEP_0185730176 /NCGR_PEP_ID=MMETSP1171-20130828/8716_1 /TAXON_ID=374046 /ORGANISM="Helicotheca tamensis, Strain CCMP826" /LENGTH=520 /DNA_ID=CAMNT_0028399175 /DNA_START=111 /DNA_END=1673 /DNA_ORIENTATION=-
MSDDFKNDEVQAKNPKRNYERKLSISEEAEAASSGRRRAPWPINLIEKPFSVTGPTTGVSLGEARGWGMDSAARGPLNQAGSFVGSALLRLALADAECQNPVTCTNTVYGLKPTNILTMSSVVVGLATAILMPIVGAIVDHTKYRKLMGGATAFLVCLATGLQIMISQDTWFTVLLLEIFGGFFLISHTTSVMAYLPDLSREEEDLSHYTARFNIAGFTVQMIYVAIVVGISEGIGANNLETARISLIVCFPLSTILLGYAWVFLFRKRPPLSEVPPGSNLVTTGFKQVGRTSMRIFTKYKSLRWFMFALLWSPESGAGAVLSITVTFMVTILRMSTIQVGITNLILLLFTLPGSLLSKKMIAMVNPLRSFQMSLVFFSLSVAITAAVLDSEEKKHWTYLFAVFWGIAFGWVYPSQRVLQCTLIPKGQETEMMGVFAFFAQLLGWLPPLIFSIMNQKGVDMRWGVSMISFFIFFAFLITLLMGSYEHALSQVNPAESTDLEFDEEQQEKDKDVSTDENES